MRESRQERLGIRSGLAYPEYVAVLRDAFRRLLANAALDLVSNLILVFLDHVYAVLPIKALVKRQLILEILVLFHL